MVYETNKTGRDLPMKYTCHSFTTGKFTYYVTGIVRHIGIADNFSESCSTRKLAPSTPRLSF